jgi:hypothetical protein
VGGVGHAIETDDGEVAPGYQSPFAERPIAPNATTSL